MIHIEWVSTDSECSDDTQQWRHICLVYMHIYSDKSYQINHIDPISTDFWKTTNQPTALIIIIRICFDFELNGVECIGCQLWVIWFGWSWRWWLNGFTPMMWLPTMMGQCLGKINHVCNFGWWKMMIDAKSINRDRHTHAHSIHRMMVLYTGRDI